LRFAPKATSHIIPTPAVLVGPAGTVSLADLAAAVQNCPDLRPEVKAEVLRLISQS
jgi:hypothetical protein